MGEEILTFGHMEIKKKNLPPLDSYFFKGCRY